jgi:GNAT superfamily N-acetyltransferase
MKSEENMLKKAETATEINTEFLKENHYGMKILSYLSAYGTNFDFCQFFVDTDKGGIAALIYNTLTATGDFDKDEFSDFVHMHEVARVEWRMLTKLKAYINGYNCVRRTMFGFPVISEKPIFSDGSEINLEPLLDDVYAVLREGFPNILQHDLWLADTSHRIRHGISKFYTFNNSACASVLYDIDDNVLIGQVATKLRERGRGYAKYLLYSLGYLLQEAKKNPVLYALDVRRDFYERIGFKELEVDYVLERK